MPGILAILILTLLFFNFLISFSAFNLINEYGDEELLYVVEG